MIKTFDKNGNFTKQALKTRFPKYVCYIQTEQHTQPFTKAMTTTDIATAKATIEKAIKNNKKVTTVFAAIWEQGGCSFSGAPYYEMTHGFSAKGEVWEPLTHQYPALWQSEDFANDSLAEWSREGKFVDFYK